ncbi:short-chain dehydrogenase/reductase [Hypoxylon fragiforme]|uniref:short-chain dehydrogenase/reductase n=1 Tax=Hypoxylon fragiforme TaxID=63214 RepID=UPI0020C686AC|nr:short-chain dehydrogenase/reductase [Hypoxylon fragiforme]KAI2603105.1 short-chain dehydrogenase/reductase [Hypoxylon fragiforme]
MSALSFLRSQLFVKLPVPSYDFTGQTVLITGGNRGIGFEAARHVLRLNAAHVIIAVRALEGSDEAVAELEKSTGRQGVVSIYELEMLDQKSVEEFAAKMQTLDRLDAVILNAGMFTQDFVLAEGYESTLTVNVINTFLLAILLLPVLRSSAQKWKISPRLTIVASDRHVMVNLPESKEGNTFQVLSDKRKAKMNQRYFTSKLLLILLGRELASQLVRPNHSLSSPDPCIIVNFLTPGYCISGLTKNSHFPVSFGFWVMTKTVARTTEEGGRTLVAGIVKGKESHGKYLNDCEIDDSALSPFVRSDDGARTQKKVWAELLEILENKHPGISSLISEA